jgi:hypothetical protein
MGEHHERDSRRIIGAARLDLAFSEEGQLLPEKEIFRRQLRSRSEAAQPEPHDLHQQSDGGPPHG